MTRPPSDGRERALPVQAGPQNSARRTGAALVACGLGVLPLKQVFTDWAWLPDSWVAILLTLGPAALLRMSRPARSVHLLPGLALTACYLTAQFVPDHAWAGILPLPGAWPDINALITAFGDTVNDSSAPLQSTSSVRFMLAVLLAFLAVAVDLLGVVARRPALAGVAFLVLVTLAGAIPRHSVGWLWFVLAAAGYLLLLASDTRDELSRWGRLMPRRHGASRAAVNVLSARRIGIIAIVIALAVPLVLPVRDVNLLSDALHGGAGGGHSGVGLDPFVKLKGQLVRPEPQKLLDVTTSGLGDLDPFYLRQKVLDRYEHSGWAPSDTGATEPLASTAFEHDPPSLPSDVVTFTATITSDGLADDRLPFVKAPTGFAGLSGKWAWNPRDGTLVGGRIGPGDRYIETVAEPRPSRAQLAAARAPADLSQLQRWLQVPARMPPGVVSLVRQLTAKASTPFAEVTGILDYLTVGNGFTYSLSTKDGDTGSDLADFLLEGRAGYCQQYAGAVGIMLRMAGVPARVVLGYTHLPPDADGHFVVTTGDAHAWVEAYFAGIGWVPFDPTPLVGSDAGRAVTLPWVPKRDTSSLDVPAGPNGASSGGRDVPNKDVGAAQGSADTGSTGGGGLPMWGTVLILALVALLVVLAVLPALVRVHRRRTRLRAAARSPDPLWQELADTAVDLGYVWSPVRSPRQVVAWLRREGVRGDADGALQTLARAVELSRYAGPRHDGAAPLAGDLRRIEGALRAQRTGWERTRARLLPGSLGWPRRPGRRGRHA